MDASFGPTDRDGIPCVVIAGVASGVGKTTVTAGLVGALRELGLVVQTFKCGPDYLDPTYHQLASGRPCHNLDGWMMGREAVQRTFTSACHGADFAVVEGVMGLFDGASPRGEAGSTAEIAKWLGAPVLLVVDASGMAASIAAVAKGFATFDPKLNVAGVVVNRVGSPSHLALLKEACRDVPVLGGFVKNPQAAFAERYLGLKAARGASSAVIAPWAEAAKVGLDLSAIRQLASSRAFIGAHSAEAIGTTPSPRRCRIAIARDDAFDFYYAENLRLLEDAGAELVFVSPLTDAHLPSVDGLYFGGGYPELHGATLAANQSFMADVRNLAAAGAPIYAECGGLIYLASAVQLLGGECWPMLGLLPGTVRLHDKLMALGYAEVEIQAPTLFGGAGLRFRGHQFRYSELAAVPTDVARVYSVRRRRAGDVTLEGYAPRANILASYVHAHWASNELLAHGFVASAEGFRRRNIQHPQRAGVTQECHG